MDTLSNAGGCLDPRGFRSYAPAPLTDACAPGTIVPGCKAVRRYEGAIPASTMLTIIVDPFQVLRILALVRISSSAGVRLTEWTVDGQSLFPKMEETAGSGIVAGLGDIASLTPELYRSGLNPLPPQPNIDNTHPAKITFAGALADTFAVLVYLGNPA